MSSRVRAARTSLREAMRASSLVIALLGPVAGAGLASAGSSGATAAAPEVQGPEPSWGATAAAPEVQAPEPSRGATAPAPEVRGPEPSWEAITVEATELLRSLVQMRTVTPPGLELSAARFLVDRIRREGIEATLVESAPDRGNVMARLPGDGSRRPLVLLCHLDTVPVEPRDWQVPPFSGVIRDGMLYGRGAIDDKGMCVANLLAFLELHRRRIPLARDVVFLATADEEAGGSGVRFMLDRFPRELAAEYVLNEGGVGLKDAVQPGQILFAVSAAEKGYAEIHLVATGKSGHGSTPRAGQAPDRLREALAHLAGLRPPMELHAYARETLRRLGEARGGVTGFLERHSALAPGLVLRTLANSESSRAMVANTINLTMLKAGNKINVVPGLAEAWLDCRLLPGMSLEGWREYLQLEVARYGVEVRLDGGQTATSSPWDTELFRALEHRLSEGLSEVVVAPILSPGFSDSKPFRERGAIAYGVAPFVVTAQELEGVHGADERLRLSELGAGTRRVFRTVVDVAGK